MSAPNTLRDEMLAFARSQLRVPYQHQGRLPGKALDCAGLLVCLAWAFGLKPRSFDVRGYPPGADGQTLQRLCDEHMQPIERDEMQPADWALVAWRNGPPQHLGMLAPYRWGGLAIIHALGPRQPARVVETRLMLDRSMRLVRAYRVPGIG